MVAPHRNGAPALDFLDLLRAALLGILQGLTEFLPVSSTAHLILGADLIGYDDPGGAFTVMIQLGSILAVMWLYRQRIIDVVTGLVKTRGAPLCADVVSGLPAGRAGGLFRRAHQGRFTTPWRIAGALLIGGC